MIPYRDCELMNYITSEIIKYIVDGKLYNAPLKIGTFNVHLTIPVITGFSFFIC